MDELQMDKLQKFQKSLQDKLYGKDSQSNWDKGLCIKCKQSALANCYSEGGKREFAISGLCEKCFNELFDKLFGNKEGQIKGDHSCRMKVVVTLILNPRSFN